MKKLIMCIRFFVRFRQKTVRLNTSFIAVETPIKIHLAFCLYILYCKMQKTATRRSFVYTELFYDNSLISLFFKAISKVFTVCTDDVAKEIV